ncbi:MAG: hypothetical protein AAGJ81_08085 [Verrucomicrobiota bacterium]
MRKFVFGFATGIAVTIVLAIGLFLLLSERVERGFFGPWEESQEPRLELILYPSNYIELRDTFGMSAVELSEFLAQGDEEKKNGYLSAFESGLATRITFIHIDDGPERTQEVTFKDGKVESHIFEISSDVEINIDTPSTSKLVESDIDFLNSERLLKAVEKRLNGSMSPESDATK